jgi:hypothetical protein
LERNKLGGYGTPVPQQRGFEPPVAPVATFNVARRQLGRSAAAKGVDAAQMNAKRPVEDASAGLSAVFL